MFTWTWDEPRTRDHGCLTAAAFVQGKINVRAQIAAATAASAVAVA